MQRSTFKFWREFEFKLVLYLYFNLKDNNTKVMLFPKVKCFVYKVPKDNLNDLRYCIQMAVNVHKTYYFSSCIIWKPQKWQNISLLKRCGMTLVSQVQVLSSKSRWKLQYRYETKGQLISEWLFDVLNFPKNQRKNLMKSGWIKKIKALYYNQ